MKLTAKSKNGVIYYTVKIEGLSFECTDISEINHTTVESLTYIWGKIMQKITYKCEEGFTKTLEINDEVSVPETISAFVTYDTNAPEATFCSECKTCKEGTPFMYQPKESNVLHLYKTCFVSREY